MAEAKRKKQIDRVVRAIRRIAAEQSLLNIFSERASTQNTDELYAALLDLLDEPEETE